MDSGIVILHSWPHIMPAIRMHIFYWTRNWSHVATHHRPPPLLLVTVTILKNMPKAALFQIVCGWNWAGLFFK